MDGCCRWPTSVSAMSRKKNSAARVGSTDVDCGNWSEEDKRELRLILMADELAEIAYRTVDWRRAAVLGRAIVALAEKGELRDVK
jgi:hypothetical protein